MHLSSVRFLPLVPAAFPRELAEFVGVSTIETATTQRASRLLRSLHERQTEYLGSTPRQGTDEGRAYVSLHRRLYDRLSTFAEQAAEAVAEVGVLVTEGVQLRFVLPAQARHDNGEYTAYKKHFIGRVPFLAVKADQGRIATTLGVPRFELKIERAGSDPGTDVTERVRPFIHDRAVELLAIVCFYSLGGPTLELGSRSFRERAQRRSALQVRQVEDLELQVRVADLDVSATIGAGQNEDLFVEGPRSVAPVLYHDLGGDRWEDRFRRLLGPYLADILENDAYATVFRILVQQDTEAEIAGFLLELGIGEDQVKEVADLVESTNRVVRAEEERWWRVLLPLLGIGLAVDATDVAWRDRLRSALMASGLLDSPTSLGALLLRRPGTEGARSDIEPDGVLAMLEAHGVDIEQFDHGLRQLGDRGLDARGPQRRMDSWARAHGTEVVAVLAEAGDSEAVHRPANWRLAADLAWAVRTAPATYLLPVIDDLETAGLGPIDADMLGGPDASDYLAARVGLDAEGLLDRWRARTGTEGHDALLREQAAAWRRVLRPILVAGRLDAGAPGYEIRSEAEAVDREFAGIDRPGDIADRLDVALPRAAALAEALADYVRTHRSIGVPSADELATFAAQHITDPAHLERVRAVLAGTARKVVDRVRRAGATLREIGVTPTPVATSPTPPPPPPPVERQHIRAVRRGRTDTDRIGAAAESWALGAVVQTLLDLPQSDRASVTRQMIAKLAEHFESDVVGGLIGRAEASLQALDEDEAIDALIAFLHVSQMSDDFGFDLIGYLPGTVGAPPEVLFLEVKSSAGRSFIVSTHEWDVAKREDLRASYAFLVVQRGEGGQPKAMEVLRDPATLLEHKRITRRENDWRVDYVLESHSGEIAWSAEPIGSSV